ncbi:MAG: hypothetical protein HY815_28890, partial [Candidatus Riflebacteria bacterium]|nr:hypothetical protein [Candidatus Riflebacteria bacterium]
MRCETELLTDDLQIGTRDDGFIYCQMKRTVVLTNQRTSDLAAALDQFVCQYLERKHVAHGPQPWDRPMNQERDRLVLVTSTASSAKTVVHLNRALDKLRAVPAGLSLGAAMLNKREAKALEVVRTIIERCWIAKAGSPPTDTDTAEFLALVRIEDVEVEKNRLGQRGPVDLLAANVVAARCDAGTAWSVLVDKLGSLTATRAGADLMGLRRILHEKGIRLRTVGHQRDAIKALESLTQETLKRLAVHASIRFRGTELRAQRACSGAIRQAAESGTVVVIGEPGAGKSGVLHTLAESLLGQGRDVVYVDAEDLPDTDKIVDVLEAWDGRNTAFVIVDSLDAVRSTDASRRVRRIISDVASRAGRWRVVAAVRRFDLGNSVELQALFAGEPPSSFT